MKATRTALALKAVTILVGVYGFLWLALEGNLTSDLMLASGILVIALGRAAMRYPGSRALSGGQAVGLAAGAGLAFGLGLPLLTLTLMALKTGLHAHGPEYSAAHLAWVWSQLPLGAVAGLAAGSGAGLLWVGLTRR